MSRTLAVLLIIVLMTSLTSCSGQVERGNNDVSPNPSPRPIVGGGCDGCELMYIGIPKEINSIDTSAGWHTQGQKLTISGTVYRLGKEAPEPNVIIYYWHTDTEGYYSPKEDMEEQAKRHGYLRGWVKSDDQGRYCINTIRPAAYPNSDIPAHIHISIKEPLIENEYYVDEFVFDDDDLLTDEKRNELENRGGSGVLKVMIDAGIQLARHDIILGLNIPNYPKNP